MPEPKIARRCPTCQASIRGEAFFCPQCGNKLDRPQSKPAPSIHDTEEVIIDGSQTLTESDFRARNKEKGPGEPGKSPPRQRALSEVGSKIQRVTNKARVVEGDVIQRVQKFREMSNVVIDEASYDPSLRFVLVAAVLFVLFLVIVLLNKVIG
jgi:hypothetical protein